MIETASRRVDKALPSLPWNMQAMRRKSFPAKAAVAAWNTRLAAHPELHHC